MKKNNHCKNALKIILFFIIQFPAFIQLSYISRKNIEPMTKIKAGFYALERNTLDVCFIGTSGTYSAFCPMEAWKEYGFTSYNFCTNDMGEDTYIYAIKEILKTQKPQVLVVDVHPFVMHHRVADWTSKEDEFMVRYNTDGYRYSLNRCALIFNVVPRSFNKISIYFDILKYAGGSFDYSLLNFALKNPQKGYSNILWEEGHPATQTDEIKVLEPDNEKDLTELIEYCKTKNIPVLFFYYPYGEARTDGIAYLNYIQQKVTQAGLPFMNCEEFLEEFNLDYMQDFWGNTHWNIYGAEKITKVVSKRFMQMYHFKDKRTDAKYADWNEDIAAWDVYASSQKEFIDNDKAEKLSQIQ